MKRKPNSGIILLVVLSMLTFFSLLVAAYLVFSNQSRATAFAIASTKTRAPEPNKMLDDAMMRLLVGTGDDSLSFFGEDLLSDYYGRSDALEFRVINGGAQIGTSGFVRVRVQREPTATTMRQVDDLYAGRVITFEGGPLVNRSYRMVRSLEVTSTTQDFVIELSPELLNSTTLSFISTPPTGANAVKIWMNGVPNNSPGIGFDNTLAVPEISRTATRDEFGGTAVGFTLPVALQPNHLTTAADKSGDALSDGSDFDEGYDAADFNNWFLSHRHSDGTVIPSFHRPSVINYILNEFDNWEPTSGSGPRSPSDYANLMASVARGTFRPLPIANGQLGSNPALNEYFTGGNSSFALRKALRISNEKLVNQVARALVEGEWDVDNDADGVNDSIWVNLGLPLFTAPDGKLLRPLVAPMIEDLSGRLNVNAHHNASYTSATMLGVSSSVPSWAGEYTGAAQAAFRGLGYGPAEIALPLTGLDALVNVRYRNPSIDSTVTNPTPGFDTNDALDLLRTGARPPMHTAAGGYGYSTDPFGRGGIGIGLSGQLVAGVSGTQVRADNTATPSHNELANESINDPYESDPSGLLSGDLMLTADELEAILRANEFDIDMLPARLRTAIATPLASDPTLARAITTHSKSDDTPPPVSFTNTTNGDSLYESLVDFFPSTFTKAQINRLIAPELRLGRKIDVNRPLGNGFDDDGNGVIDEPIEVAAETEAFKVAAGASGTVPTSFQGQTPDYNFDEPSTVDSRQLLARHLYVLMMLLTNGAADFPDSNNAALPGYKSHRIAQWAVNVVDYRDPDSIMTAFEYDVDPLNGWDVDGDISTVDTKASNLTDGIDNDGDGAIDEPDEDQVRRGVVWGVEAPELVFSESFASHDVRLRDTDRDGGIGTDKSDTTNPDPDSDQVRIPQGSMVLELYCPRPTVNTAPTSATVLGDQTTLPGAPQELYTTDANANSSLNLSLTAPPVGGGVGAPVWRIAITERHDNAAVVPVAKQNENPATLRVTKPDTASFQIEYPDEIDTTAGALKYDRFILFQNYGDAAADPVGALTAVKAMIDGNNLISEMSAEQVFYAPTTGALATANANKNLEAGQFLCLAPRLVTRFGSKESSPGVFPGLPSEQRLTVSTTQGILQARHDGTRITPSMGGATDSHSNALALVIAAPRPTNWPPPPPPLPASTWTAATDVFDEDVVGLNVSEPLPNGGSYYPEPMQQYNGTIDSDSVGGPDFPRTDAYLNFSDPASSARDTPLDVGIGRVPVDSTGREPAMGTRSEYCSAFLQRLADPTRAYNAVTNPYRTVDWIPIDLTVFSGEERESKISTDGALYTRRTRQRNGYAKPPTGAPVAANALFSYETDFLSPGVTVDATTPDYFAFSTVPADAHLQSSLSFLNTDTQDYPDPVVLEINKGFSGFGPFRPFGAGITGATIGSDPAGSAITGHDRGLPRTPFGIHPWLNRPFATPFELMMVPACSQGRLFEEFNITSGNPDIYPNSPTVVSAQLRAPFRHLLNFFHSQDSTNVGSNVDRIFDFVHTLPPFRGEVDMIHPARVTSTGLSEMMTPPFNMTYDNQRQARINLNTLSESVVWEGLMQGHLYAAGGFGQMEFVDFIRSRRGYPQATTGRKTTDSTAGPFNYAPTYLDPELPTQFAGMFRDWRRANFAPMLRIPPDNGDTAAQDRLRRNPIDGTLLRRHYTMTITGNDETITSDPYPQLVRQASAPPVSTHLDRGRNPFLRYQTLMRMPNLVSDNSQVFLIRMTMGFFEVDPTNINSLGREYKEAIGENKRYQAMFIIDRSIPVGFIPGQETNARNTVIFERFYQ